jgi:hypothetical protein
MAINAFIMSHIDDKNDETKEMYAMSYTEVAAKLRGIHNAVSLTRKVCTSRAMFVER